ncbi:hypothetical protein [Spirosoma lituiforme]
MRKPLLITFLVAAVLTPVCLLGYLDSFVLVPICLIVLLYLMVKEAQKK